MTFNAAKKRQDSVTHLEVLETLSVTELRQAWANAYGHSPPAKLSQALLLRVVAYQEQSRQYGGLSGYLRRRLLTFADDKKSTSHDSKTSPPSPKLIPGNQLVREWQGTAHRVRVNESGFEYQGRPYRSLSQIARHITGTSWSGPAFFGLKNKKSGQEVIHE